MDLTFYYWGGGAYGSFAPTNGAPIDWNHDGAFDTDVCGDVSGNEPLPCGSLPTLQPSNDWASHAAGGATVFENLQLQYQRTRNSSTSYFNPRRGPQ